MRELTEIDKQKIIDSIPSTSVIVFCPGLQGRAGTIIDRSQSVNPGTITSASWKRLANGLLYLDFDAVDDVVSFGTGPTLGGAALTINVWVKPTWAGMPNYGGVFSQYGDAVKGYLFDRSAGNNWLRFVVNPGAGEYSKETGALVTGTWYMVTVTHDGVNSLYLYVNGSALPVKNGVTVNASTQTVYMGRGFQATARWKGSIALPLMVDGAALTAAEILRIYTRQRRYLGA